MTILLAGALVVGFGFGVDFLVVGFGRGVALRVAVGRGGVEPAAASVRVGAGEEVRRIGSSQFLDGDNSG